MKKKVKNQIKYKAIIVFFVQNKFGRHYLKMETIFMNTENSKTNEPHIFKLDLRDKRNLQNLHLEKHQIRKKQQ